jgi:hypothetical protein
VADRRGGTLAKGITETIWAASSVTSPIKEGVQVVDGWEGINHGSQLDELVEGNFVKVEVDDGLCELWLPMVQKKGSSFF